MPPLETTSLAPNPRPWGATTRACADRRPRLGVLAVMMASALLSGPSLSAVATPDPSEAQESVRIAVGRFRGPLTISGPDLRLIGGGGERYDVDGPVVVAPGASGVLLAGKPVRNQILRVENDSELTLSGHRYRRILEVSFQSYRGRPELLVVHPVPMETYVAGIVGSELPHRWPFEAKKAQAVAARTYAIWQKYRRLDLPYHMESSVLDQVYHGAEREHDEAIRAAAETRGQVLTWGRRPAQAYFHAACGDHTESAREGWGTPLPYLPGSRCGFCKSAHRYRWDVTLSWDEVDKALHRVLGARPTSLRIVSKTKTGRAKSVVVEGNGKKRTITGADLRRLLGYTKVWSTMITDLKTTPSGVRIAGKGAGHGVGMCQWGARGMAEKGIASRAILEGYYPGAKLLRLY